MYESYFRGFLIPVPHLSTFNLPTFYCFPFSLSNSAKAIPTT